MFKLGLSWVLGLCVLWSGVTSAATLEVLAREASRLESDLKLAVTQAEPLNQKLMWQVANLLSKQENCDTAREVRLASARAGYPIGHAFWLALTKDSHCQKDWRQASRLAYRALQASEQPDEQARSLSYLAYALENRRDWNHDWQPLAFDLYKQLSEQVDEAWVIRRMAVLKARFDELQTLNVSDVSARNKGASASLCVHFDDEMPEPQDYAYADYIQPWPTFDAVFEVSYSEVCLRGAEYGKDYDLKLKQGLAGSERRLMADASVTINSGQREPAMWFKRSAYVLAQHQAAAVPLQSVNVAKVRARMLRVHERNIMSPFVQGRFQSRLDGYALESLATELGEVIWEGDVDLSTAPNQVETSALALPKDLIQEPGLYVVAVADAKQEAWDWNDRASQWLVVSDIGLVSYQGSDSLLLEARSLASAKPLADVSLRLMSRNNQILAEANTDTLGHVRFPAGLLRGKAGREAVQITAVSEQAGFNFLSLKQAAFDLSDRGVEGREPPGAMDFWLTPERGVYRPGESVHVLGLLRNAQGHAVTDMPLTWRLSDPSGRVVEEQVVPAQAAGAYTPSFEINRSARTGRWTLAAFVDPDAPALASTDWLVEMIAPPRLEVALEASGVLQVDAQTQVQVQADYLFGAPVVDRPVKASVSLEPDPTPFPAFKAYHFGKQDEPVREPVQWLDELKTDAAGHAMLALALEQSPQVMLPIRARVHVDVVDIDGRVAQAETLVPVRHRQRYIGIHAPEQVAEQAQTEIALINLNAEGLPQSEALNWRLVREDWDYQWFEKNGDWAYERVRHESLMQQGELLSQLEPVSLSLALEEGEYRLEVFEPVTQELSSVRLQVGQRVAGQGDGPDKVELSLGKATYQDGETAQLRFDAPYAGQGSVVIASHTVHSVQQIEVVAGEQQIEIPVSDAWGAGAYVMLNVYEPGQDANHVRKPRRAMGLVWLGLDQSQHRLAVTIDAPEKVGAKQHIELPIQVTGGNEQAYVNLAAVDEGVLQLTGFESPDPLDYLFAKRRLGTQIRDLYGKLIEPVDARPDQLRSGGDAAGREGMPAENIKIVSLFSGVVSLDEQGKARVPVSIPEYQGRLRLMAVAWDAQRVGSTQADLPVRDPMVVQASLPRFLSVGDHGEIRINLHNLDAPTGEYRVAISGDSVVQADDLQQAFSMENGQQRSVAVAVRAMRLGESHLKLNVTGPDGFAVTQELNLGVRGPWAYRHDRELQRIEPGQVLEIAMPSAEQWHAADTRVMLDVSANPGLDVRGLLDELDRYPHGCLEQTTSRALPLLYVNALAQDWGLEVDPALAVRVQTAVRRLQHKQLASGGFSLWEGGSEAPWAGAYAMEFLVRAKQSGYSVSDYGYSRGLDYLRQLVDRSVSESAKTLSEQTYAHYVLALAAQGLPEQARHLADNHPGLPTPLAYAQLGATMALMGDEQRAKTLFDHAARLPKRLLQWRDYGSELRDMAAVVSLMQEHGQLMAGDLVSALIQKQNQQRWTSTQEQAWLVLAARALGGSNEAMSLAVGPEAKPIQQSRWSTTVDMAESDSAIMLKNQGAKPVWLLKHTAGSPKQSGSETTSALTLERRWFDLQGQAVDPARVEQGQMLVVVLEGESNTGLHHQALLVDRIPAGFELENPRMRHGMGLRRLSWLSGLQELEYQETLDDRYVAAFDIQAGKHRRFRLAYMMRAVTPGDYQQGTAVLEDMYQPMHRLELAPHDVSIRPAP